MNAIATCFILVPGQQTRCQGWTVLISCNLLPVIVKQYPLAGWSFQTCVPVGLIVPTVAQQLPNSFILFIHWFVVLSAFLFAIDNDRSSNAAFALRSFLWLKRPTDQVLIAFLMLVCGGWAIPDRKGKVTAQLSAGR